MSGSPQYSVVPGHIDLFARGEYSSTRVDNGYSGKIFVTPLLPADAQLRRVGGTGYECWVDNNWTSGTNYPPADPSWYTNEFEVGQWRVETIAPGAPDSVSFLHYIFVGQPSEAPPVAQTLNGTGMIGCDIPGVGVIVFGRQNNGDPIRYQSTGENFTLPQFVGGLQANTAYLIREDQDPPRLLIAGTGGTLSFHLERPGEVTIQQAPMAWRP
jgi:hypothetical protein